MKLNRLTLPLTLAAALALAACTTVRETKPLSYAGDGRVTVASIEAELSKRGFKPICRERAFCKFEFKDGIWIHFKAAEKRVVLVVDVKGGKDMPPDQVNALSSEAMKAGEDIFAAASNDAQQREAAAAQRAREEAEREAAEEARREQEEREAAAREPEDSGGGGVLGALTAVGDAMDSVKVTSNSSSRSSSSSSSSSSARCCVNGSYYDCPSAAALNKCGGALGRCMMGCMNSSDMSCSDKCVQKHPPDPSGCTRVPANDGQCKR